MRRREFITLFGGAVASSLLHPLAARAQQPDHMRRIGVLAGLAENDPEISGRLAGFRQGLEKLGWVEGGNVRIDYRFAPGGTQARVLARELVSLRPDVILGQSTPAVAALQLESRTIPIVFAGIADPIGSGFVMSLARPGGNLTGLLLYEEGITGKWLGMLREIAPRLERAALVANPKTTSFDYFLRSAKALAPSLAIDIVPSPVENAADIEPPLSPSRASRTAAWSCHRTSRPSPIAISSSRSRPSTICLRFTRSAFSSRPVVSCSTEPTSSTCFDRRRPMSTTSCAVQSPPTFRCRRRPDTKRS
jgi:putative tryptophan/tyrosine transport system substrate-binding protein